MKNLFKKILGIDKVEAEIKKSAEEKIANLEAEMRKAAEEKLIAEKEAQVAKEQERIAKLSPKELATEKKEPWISVLNTHINKDNVRNGFFELDWNEHFVLQLRKAGYRGATDEEIVDIWFQELCRNVGAEANISMEQRGSGFVTRALRDDGRTENS